MCAPSGPNVNGLAVALLVEHLGRDVAEAARERMQLLLGRVEVLGAVQKMIVRGVPDRADSGEWGADGRAYMPKSAITMSECSSFVR